MPLGNTLPAVLAGASAKAGEVELANQRIRASDPDADPPGGVDTWSHTWEGLGDRGWLPESRADRKAAMDDATLENEWSNATSEAVGESFEGQLAGLGRQLALLLELDEPEASEGEVDPEGFLANLGATFEVLTSLEQILTTPFALVPFPAFPAIRVMDMDVGFPHGHAHPPNTPPVPPAPFPSTGPIIPIPFLSGATRTLINGMPAARCGDVGLGIWCGGYFPMYEVFFGSSSVWIEGQRAGRILVDMTHHCIFSNPKGPKGQDTPVGVPIGTMITSSANVLIGGMPLPSLLDFAVGKLAEHLFAGLAKAAKRLKEGGEGAFKRLAARSADDTGAAGGRAADDVADTVPTQAVDDVADTVPTRAVEGGADTVPMQAAGRPTRRIDEASRFVDELEQSGAIQVKGHDDFNHAVKNDLDAMARTETGRELLEQIKANHVDAGKKVTIEPMRPGDYPANGGMGPHCEYGNTADAMRTPDGHRSAGGDSTIRYEAGETTEGWGAGIDPQTGRYVGGESVTSDTVLAHEMVHARNGGRGDVASQVWDTSAQKWTERPSGDYRFPNPEEAEAVRLENRYRAEKGYGGRPDYYNSGEVAGTTREVPAVTEHLADSISPTQPNPAVQGNPGGGGGSATPGPSAGNPGGTSSP